MGEFVDIYDETRCILSKMSQATTFKEISDLEKEFCDVLTEYRKIQYKRIVIDRIRSKEK